uniref:Tick transposon n=1 Tax=Rodentolepis nana TaxID=102285 RepID=A0A0R3TX41_RODNA
LSQAALLQAFHRELSQAALFFPQGAVTTCTLFNVDRELSQAALFSMSSSIYKQSRASSTYFMQTILFYVRQQWNGYQHHENCIPNIFTGPPLHKSAFTVQGYFSRKTNEFTYLGMTFDTKLTWESHAAKVAERVSKRLNVLKRLAGSIWRCARSTLNTIYKMFVQPIMLSCYVPLTTASEVIRKPLENAHNQALRLITGGIKSTPKLRPITGGIKSTPIEPML